jgi:hypothetical protein
VLFEVVMSFVKKIAPFALAALAALPLVGCAADATNAEEDAEASEDALRQSRVEPGEFKLYAEAGITPSAFCDVYTKLELVNEQGGRAKLQQELGRTSRCRIAVRPNPREYRLHQVGTSCGSKIYSGTRRKDGQTYRIKITDHRSRMCRDLVPARVIVEETEAGSTSTSYSYDGPDGISGQFPAGGASSLSGKLFTAMKNHAQENPQSETAKFVQAIGGSTVTFEKDGDLAQCTGAVLAGGVQYTCHFEVKPGGFDWTMSSDSVQAELHEALRVATNGGRIAELKDNAGNGLRCEAATLGMAQVMSYKCDVSFAH